MKRLSTFLLALLLTWIGANAQIADGSYMVVNTETGQFLYGSYNWGSCASLGSKPVYYTVAATSGGYTLTSTQWTATDKGLFLTGDGAFYCDGTPGTVVLTEADDGSYTMSISGTYMLAQGKNATITATADASQASHFKFVSLQDVINDMASATSASPVDVTALIDDANFKPNGNGLTAKNNWTESGITGHGRYNNNGNTVVDACCAESWNQDAFSISQTITLPCKGVYSLSAQGFYRNGSDGNGNYAVSGTMYAGEHTMALPAKHGSEGDMPSAWAAFLEGTEPIDAITFEAEEDNTSIEIGFRGAAPTYSWVIFGELTLMYYGETLTYAIGDPECSVTTVTPGGTVSITFPNCVTPSTDEPQLASGKYITVDGSEVTATLSYSGTTATVTFTVPETVQRGTTVTVVVPQGLVEWSGQSVSSPATETTFYLTTPLIADQLGVYLFNLGENEFLSRGHNYDDSNGTAADVDVYGLPVDITANADGKYNIRYIDSNLYLGGMYWATANEALASAASFTIVAEDGTTTDGKTIYRFRNGSSNSSVTGDLYVNNGTSHGPLGLNDDANGINSEADRQWVIYSKDERDALKAANVLAAKLATAQALDPSFSGTTEDAFDTFISNLNSEVCTSKVGGASLSTDTDLGYWTAEYVTEDTETGTSGTGFAAGSGVIETYDDVDDLTQTITGLEEGIYKVTLQGYNRMGDAAYILANLADYDISLATLGANDDEINLKTWASDRPTEEVYNSKYASLISSNDSYFNLGYNYFPNSQYQASLIFGDEAYQNELYTYVSNGSLTITIACPDYLGANWVVFTNMTLTRYYTEDPYVYDVTKMLANPSFEEYEGELNEDTTRNHTDDEDAEGSYTGGAYSITSDQLTGWNLTVAGISSLMTEDCKRTDNDFGAPGEPTDGTYMLYLRDSWATAETTLKQDVTLPAGEYKVAVDTKCISTSGSTATLVVNDATTSLAIHSTMPEDWDTATLKFYLDNETTVSLGVVIDFTGANGSFLLDNFRLYSEKDIVVWDMTEAMWGTLILPFAAEIPSGLTAYSTGEVTPDADDDNATLSLTDEGTSIAANTPYIIGADDESAVGTYYFTGEDADATSELTAGKLTGTYETMDYEDLIALTGTVYLLQNHTEEGEGGVAFYPVVEEDSKDATLTPYHCYLTLTENDLKTTSGAPAKLSFSFGGEATAIKAIEGAEAEADGAIYDLSGRKVSKAVKGVYIQNGKKVLVK